MNRFRITFLIGLAACAGMAYSSYARDKAAPSAVTPAHYAESKEWPTYGHDSGGMRYSPLTQITPANVSNLTVAWTYHLKPASYAAPAGGRGGGEGRGGGRGGGTGFRAAEVTPLVVNGTMYVGSPYGQVERKSGSMTCLRGTVRRSAAWNTSPETRRLPPRSWWELGAASC
jgi:glucose dehydrogenase